MKNVFSGPDSTKDYLDPKNYASALIELHDMPNLRQNNVRIFAKKAPLDNIKLIPARYMLERAYEAGRTKGVHTLVEASSGGMASVLCDLCPYFDIPNFLAVISNDTALGRKQALNIQGARVFYENDIPNGMSMIEYARHLGTQPGYLNLCQYESHDNPDSYQKYLAPQIRMELDSLGISNKPIFLFAAMGTCGTLIGCGRYFKLNYRDCRVVGIYLGKGERVPGMRDLARLEEVGLYKDYINYHGKPNRIIDMILHVNRYQSYRRAVKMIQFGVDIGPSSGAVLEGVEAFDSMHSFPKDSVVVVICADSMKLYNDKPETILDGPEFRKA